jgi:hypothetical protein
VRASEGVPRDAINILALAAQRRYDVFKLDYGCYVDLITTVKAPLGLLPADTENGNDATYLDVPPDDYRSIRRAILSLDRFYESNTT